ncbi:phosphoribosylglycinamide formyltransferase [Hyphomicrobium sp. CS1BSMeth3]|uniref:phosphoribosylglycinamide formyltransferase n=1 Tax=Hyphomicrobium sp. CS1BSMeth3 TaxID=1892844 RepID=UPI000B09D55F|nr:phosphoribosylglycinamide formyltransferase [Hyphomicrobium sp. CS1BSMeth3]
MRKRRVGVLISGRGSNMMALVEAARAPDYPAEIVCVVSNRPGAAGLAWAREQGLAAHAVDHKAYATREAFEDALHAVLMAEGVELIACAGFMRLMTAGFVARWAGRMINIHPSLLPLYPGLNTHARALADGVRIVGCTVHHVVAEMDAGPIIAQGAVPVIDGDTPAALADRILSVEHVIYPQALALVASGKARLEDGHVRILSTVNQTARLISPDVG